MKENISDNTFSWLVKAQMLANRESLRMDEAQANKDRPRTKSELKDRISLIWDSITLDTTHQSILVYVIVSGLLLF